MKFAALALFAASLSIATPSLAQNNPVVVELYTSQGCSSCPPADAILHEIADREDVIALALHVDYWDYIGWKDTFANPAHAKRQRAYAAAGQRRSIYTPEMIVNGKTDIVGAKAMKLSKAIAEHAKEAPKVAVELARSGEDLTIKAENLNADAGLMTVHMLRYAPRRVSEIERGENAGKTIEYANVVENWQVLGNWDGQGVLTLQTDAAGDNPVVVLVQGAGAGPIFGAARLR